MKTDRQVEAGDGVVEPASRVSRGALSDRGQVSLLVCFGLGRCFCLLRLRRVFRSCAFETGFQAGIVSDALVGSTRCPLPFVIGFPALRQLVVSHVFVFANGPTPALQSLRPLFSRICLRQAFRGLRIDVVDR
jgi:hypothetical protein